MHIVGQMDFALSLDALNLSTAGFKLHLNKSANIVRPRTRSSQLN